MPRVIFSFDAHGSSASREEFGEELFSRLWIDFYVIQGTYYELPYTTLIGQKTAAEISADINAARRRAVRADINFKLTRYIHAVISERSFLDIGRRSATREEIEYFRVALGI